MVKYAEPRFERRLRARREARRLAEELANRPPSREDRRERSMTPKEVERWLKQNGIPKQRTRIR